MGHSITFFMLVTNRDALIAYYTIASYQKLMKPLYGRLTWKLIVYANCLTEKNKNHFFSLWRKYPYVEIYDNALHCSPEDFKPGTLVDPSGKSRQIYEGPFESCDLIWTREFANFTTDYWATVDADFEILKPDFVIRALDELENSPNLIAVSSDKNETILGYNTYSKRKIRIMERYSTWFCIYKKKAQKCTTSHLNIIEENADDIPMEYDSAAYFQKDLKEKFGFELTDCVSISPRFRYSFIHYGAYAKNKSIVSAFDTAIYRYLTIINHIGKGRGFVKKFLTSPTRKILRFLYLRKNVERCDYHFENPLDKEQAKY